MSQLYQALTATQRGADLPAKSGPLVTLSAESMPLVQWARWISDQTGVSIVAEASLDDRPVSVEVQDVPVEQVIGAVGRRLGVQVSRVGELYYLGTLRPEDRGVLVRRVSRLSEDELRAALDTLTSEHGRLAVYSDGLVVFSDRVEVLGRVNELLDGIEAAPADAWVVQLHLVALRDAARRALGLDVTPVAELAAVVADPQNDPRLVYRLGLAAVLTMAHQDESVKLISQPLLVASDGVRATIEQVREIPIITLRRERDGAGVVEIESINYLPIGSLTAVTVRNLGDDRARLTVELEQSAVAGQVQGQPIKATERMATEAVVESGGTYLLGSLSRSEVSVSQAGPVSVGSDRRRDNTEIQVWANCYRIGSPLGRPQP